MLNELVKQLVAILRYIAAPAVGIVVVWLADVSHDVVRVAMQAAWPWTTPPSPWPFVGFLALTGVTVYHAHRTLLHPFITTLLVGLHTRSLSPKPSVDDLAFARWRRRGAADHSAEQSAQAVLDETNAAIHFFYCSGWSSLLISLVFKIAFPTDFQLASRIAFSSVILLFLITAVVGDYHTAKLDVEAYRRFR